MESTFSPVRTLALTLPLALAATGCVHADRAVASVRSAHDPFVALASPPAAGSSSVDAAAPEGEEALDRRAMIALALAASPELATFDAELEVRLARIDLAGSVEAPELMVQVWNVPFRRPYALDDASMWMAILSQRFEARGVRRERVHAETAEARAVLAERATVALTVATRAAADHAALAQLDATLLAREESVRAYGALVTASEALVAGGRIDSRMLAEARASMAEQTAALEGARGRRIALARATNVRLGREPIAPLVVSVDETTLDLDAVRRRLVAHPALHANEARREAARARVMAATHASRRPSISVGAGFFEEPHAGTGYGLQVGLSLPWIGGRGRAERRMAEAEARRLDAELGTAQRGIAIEVETAIAELAAADAAIRAIDETSLPALEAGLRAAASGLASGSTSVRDLVAMTTRLADLRVERAEWLGARLVAESSLHAITAVLDVATEEP